MINRDEIKCEHCSTLVFIVPEGNYCPLCDMYVKGKSDGNNKYTSGYKI